ncbi:MAG: hypothetical protein AAB499_02275, partial [Patescibacteria group bacterium]
AFSYRGRDKERSPGEPAREIVLRVTTATGQGLVIGGTTSEVVAVEESEYIPDELKVKKTVSVSPSFDWMAARVNEVVIAPRGIGPWWANVGESLGYYLEDEEPQFHGWLKAPAALTKS